MDGWEVPQSSRSGLDRGLLMDGGPKQLGREVFLALKRCGRTRRARASKEAGRGVAAIVGYFTSRPVRSFSTGGGYWARRPVTASPRPVHSEWWAVQSTGRRLRAANR